MNEASIMPKYPWLAKKEIDIQSTPGKIKAMKTLGVPYPDNYEQQAIADLKSQADSIAKDLVANGIQTESNREIIALIAYIQRLGVDISNKPVKK
jgi:cytochrome c oxidase cbb3-type subunit I/II